MTGNKTLDVLGEVAQERMRQEELRERGKFPWTCAAPDVIDDLKLRVLVEEVGEVARALCDGKRADLREELIQVAAVATAWVEALEKP